MIGGIVDVGELVVVDDTVIFGLGVTGTGIDGGGIAVPTTGFVGETTEHVEGIGIGVDGID